MNCNFILFLRYVQHYDRILRREITDWAIDSKYCQFVIRRLRYRDFGWSHIRIINGNNFVNVGDFSRQSKVRSDMSWCSEAGDQKRGTSVLISFSQMYIRYLCLIKQCGSFLYTQITTGIRKTERRQRDKYTFWTKPVLAWWYALCTYLCMYYIQCKMTIKCVSYARGTVKLNSVQLNSAVQLQIRIFIPGGSYILDFYRPSNISSKWILHKILIPVVVFFLFFLLNLKIFN